MKTRNKIITGLIIGLLIVGCNRSSKSSATVIHTPSATSIPTPTQDECGGFRDMHVVYSVWEDLNGNGIQEDGEPAFKNYKDVCLYISRVKVSISESLLKQYCKNGTTGESVFPVCSNRIKELCSTVFIYVAPPDGYQLTTPSMVNDCEAKIGLMKIK